jgi:hypothetical protein
VDHRLFRVPSSGEFVTWPAVADTSTLASKEAPYCDKWHKWDVHDLDMAQPTRPEYEITFSQHFNWKGERKVRTLISH